MADEGGAGGAGGAVRTGGGLSQYALGLDLGTTAVKAKLFCRNQPPAATFPPPDSGPATLDLVAQCTVPHRRHAPPSGCRAAEAGPRAEQDVEAIFAACAEAVAGVRRAEAWSETLVVGVTGQMHGVACCLPRVAAQPPAYTPLVTWEDQRCPASFLAQLHSREPDLPPLASGYGTATLVWELQSNLHLEGEAEGACASKPRPDQAAGGGEKLGSSRDEDMASPSVLAGHATHSPFLAATAPHSAGTVADLLVARLCGLAEVVQSPSNAASFGFFAAAEGAWRTEALPDAVARLLPHIRPDGDAAGVVGPDAARDFGLPAGARVCVASGDNTCQTLALGQDYVRLGPASAGEREAAEALFVNVGTSAQLSRIVDTGRGADLAAACASAASSLELRPYVAAGSHLACVASLNGGNALETLVAGLVQIAADITGQPPASVPAVFDRIALEASALPAPALPAPSAPVLAMQPTFAGERSDPALGASLTGMCQDNWRPAALFQAASEGLARNLYRLAPEPMRKDAACLVGSGNALVRNKCLQAALKASFKLPLLILTDADAAMGAAILALRG